MSGQRNRQGTRTAGLKARTQLAPMSAAREQRLKAEGRWQPGSTFARPGKSAQCPKVRYGDELAAKLALAKIQAEDQPGHAERRPFACPRCRGWHLTSQEPDPGRVKRGASRNPDVSRSRPETGFSRSVKLAIRKRAGNGDPDQAACEACGCWLGRYGGQVHHRQNRGMGGSKLRNGVQNAALLCGTPDDLGTCHGKATCAPISAGFYEMGFCLKDGQDPAAESLMLHGRDGGITVWLAGDGSYSLSSPGGEDR